MKEKNEKNKKEKEQDTVCSTTLIKIYKEETNKYTCFHQSNKNDQIKKELGIMINIRNVLVNRSHPPQETKENVENKLKLHEDEVQRAKVQETYITWSMWRRSKIELTS